MNLCSYIYYLVPNQHFLWVFQQLCSLFRLAIAVLQRNIRKYLFLRDWKWWKLYTKVKPLLNVARTEDELRQKEEELNKLREKLQKEDAMRKDLEESQTQLMEEKNDLFVQLQRVRNV